jgi:hypothetical protein
MKIRLIEPVSGAPSRGVGSRVDIRVQVGDGIATPCDAADVCLQAIDAPYAACPVFQGTLRVEAIDTVSCRLVLAGRYALPLGVVPAVADRTALASSAKRRLRTLLSNVRAAVSAALCRSTGAGESAADEALGARYAAFVPRR